MIQSSDIAWQVSRYSTRRNFICKKSHGKGDNSVCHLYSHQTLLGKSLDVVQEDILCKNSQGKGDNSVSHWCSHQILLGKSLDIVQEEIL